MVRMKTTMQFICSLKVANSTTIKMSEKQGRDISPKKLQNGQKANERILHVTGHQGRANENHDEIQSHTP